MSKNSLELKDFVNDPTFIENMNRAFSDLRADYELSMDSTCEKINELKSLHVDVKNHLSDLTSYPAYLNSINIAFNIIHRWNTLFHFTR